MLNGGKTLSMGWTPESGFLNARWEHYCELMMIYLLGIGSPTHPLPPTSWDAWTRPTIKYQGIEYISGNDPIFTHQYSTPGTISETSGTRTRIISTIP